MDYTLKENSINGIELNEKIRDEELHEYSILDREDFIDTLIDWISEAKGNDKELMKDDLKMLINTEDDFLLSSNSTNSYIRKGDTNFNETCEELLTLNERIIQEM